MNTHWQPPAQVLDSMTMDDEFEESQSFETQTQQQTQSTQQASQQPNMDAHLWGYLQPCNQALTRIDFWKIRPRYSLGRNIQLNDVVLPGFKVSNQHCIITWDGVEDRTSSVTVQDVSSNGTFINGVKIGKNLTRILKEGNELAFGTATPQPTNGIEDYRFVYRHTAAGPPTTGVYAHYDIATELGKGSFATVMKAISRETGEWYAVKIIHDTKTIPHGESSNEANTKRIAALVREISVMERLKHPNICYLKEAFFHDNHDIYLVIELVEGGDLLTYILERDKLSEFESKHITFQMCQALAYIHGKGVAHRDLKPENVMLTLDKPPIVKIADFGLAKVVDSLTMLRTMCGTPSYLAPEVVTQKNQQGYDQLVDSWSVGVIVFCMLTGSNPFIENGEHEDVRRRVLERYIEWNMLIQAGVSAEGNDFLHRLLEEKPSQRMTMSSALEHLWFQSYTPVYDLYNVPASGSIPTEDVSMLPVPEAAQSGSAVPQDPVAAMVGAFPAQNGVKQEGGRTTRPQRRSDVLSQAAEGNGAPLAEPSQEMISRAAAEAGLGPEFATDRANKRVHSELTPLSEVEDTDMHGTSTTDSYLSPSKHANNNLEQSPRKGKSGRGRAKAKPDSAAKGRAPRSRAESTGMKEDAAGDNIGSRLRRSSRQPLKPARRA